MIIESMHSNDENSSLMGNFTIQLTNPMLYDRLHTLSVEYSVSVELLINAAVKRMIEDVDFVRSLRIGKVELE